MNIPYMKKISNSVYGNQSSDLNMIGLTKEIIEMYVLNQEIVQNQNT